MMPMTDRNRRLALAFSALTIVALLLLATGLGGLELQPGRPFHGRFTTADEGDMGTGQMRSPLDDLLLVLLGFLLAILVPVAAYYVFRAADRSRRWLYLLALLVGMAGFYLATRAQPTQEPLPPVTEVAPEMLPEEGALSGPGIPEVELEVQPPAWLSWLAAALLALLAAGLVIGTAWLFWDRARPQGPLPQLAEQARTALAELDAGADVRDVVMRCYLEMSRILEHERGLSRGEAMTPREFALALRNAGLPHEPVARLTHLFEQVRYGTARPNPEEEQQATACLSAIIAACRSTA
jgi:hypothetical protein